MEGDTFLMSFQVTTQKVRIALPPLQQLQFQGFRRSLGLLGRGLRSFWEYVLKKLALSRRNVFVLRSMRISCVLLLSRLDLLVFYSVLGGRAYFRIFRRFYATSWIFTISCVFRTFYNHQQDNVFLRWMIYRSNINSVFCSKKNILRFRDFCLLT